MEEQAVDCRDDIGVEPFAYDEINRERSSRKFCTSTTLPRSKVVFFFQAAILLILINSSLAKVLFYETPWRNASMGVSSVRRGWLYTS